MSSFSGTDSTFSNGEDELSQTQDHGKEQSAKLIVTFFLRSRAAHGSTLHTTSIEKHIWPNSFTDENSSFFDIDFVNRLASIAPCAALMPISSEILSPHVLQIIYSSSSLDTYSIRHHPLILAFQSTFSFEIVLDLVSNSTNSHRPTQLAIFDMDSTLINEEVIDELARPIGVSPSVSAITARAMNGEIDFAQSLRARLALLKGVNANIWKELPKSLSIATGAKELCAELRSRGVITAVASGGFAPMAEWLKEQLGLDYAFANHLLVSQPTPTHPYPHLSGELSPDHPIITPSEKRTILLSLATKHDIPLAHTLAVGDGANDLQMLNAAGLGIAWRAKEKVQREAPQRLNGESLEELVMLLGPRGES